MKRLYASNLKLKKGATEILGLRLGTTELGMQDSMVEVSAYGAAIKT